MYIKLPNAWRAHPFLRNSFIITSDKQIEKLKIMELRKLILMSRLFDKPSSENIELFNEGIAGVVDLILANAE